VLALETPHSALGARHSQSGVALVVTLLLLSIITFMAITFLVVTRQQKGSVVTATDQAIARLAADTALERARAELLSAIKASNNEFNYGLLVSANYINSAGFQISGSPSLPYNSPLNVSYNYPNGSPLAGNDALQNIANLLYNPRPPVFIVTNALTGSNEFRFYLDLNRNGVDDPNGLQPLVVNLQGTLYYYDLKGNPVPWSLPPPANIQIQSNFFVGDPEWIGTLARPEFPHSATNYFVNRYAYIAIPAGNTLDMNCIHNMATALWQRRLDLTGGAFRRDQGVGTWEINLAAFLADLNTNVSPLAGSWWAQGSYTYGFNPTTGAIFASGTPFADAANLLAYRYAKSANSLASVYGLFTPNGPNVFTSDGVDGYTTTVSLRTTGFPQDPDSLIPNLTRLPWSGADNPNHFYTTQELFDESKTAAFATQPVPSTTPTFTKRLAAFGSAADSYDRYTFYRLLSQLGTDSAPEPPGKLNLNYCNVDSYGNVVLGMETNFIPWTPIQFFTNAAIRLLANAGYTAGIGPTNLLYVDARGVTNLQIQLYPINFYTPSVQRLLQLAANIYDATTTRTIGGVALTNLPSVFRPLFKNNNGNPVFITGYEEVTNTAVLNYPWLDLTMAKDRQNARNQQMVWGIPLIIGAKKGLPNFNKFSLQTQVQVTRKLQFHRPGNSNTAKVNEIDQMFVVGITNALGIEAWNSYSNTYPRSVRLVVMPDLTLSLTNLETRKLLNPVSQVYNPPVTAMTIAPNAWPGYDPSHEGYSFVLPLTSAPGMPYTNVVALSNMTYRASADTFVPLTGRFDRTPGATNLHVPHWQLSLRSRLRFAIIDTSPPFSPSNGRIVDYANLDSALDPLSTNAVDIAAALGSDANCGNIYTAGGSPGSMWCTNRQGGATADSVPTYGILSQIAVSSTPGLASDSIWNSSHNEFPGGMSKAQAIAFFQGQFTPGYLAQSNTFAAPFQPFRNLYVITEWEANDPLVHYTIGDLRNLQHTNSFELDNPDSTLASLLGHINQRYEPWGGNPKKTGSGVNAPVYELRVKDPVAGLQGRSDDWGFPTNKLPNVGWLGRVHRGTPWQTVYLKSGSMDLPSWQKWTGNGQIAANVGQISPNLVPVATNLNAIPLNSLVADAYFTHPTNDWHILDLFTAALSDNATRGQLSINQTNLAAWSAVLSGVIAFTNTALVGPAGNQILDANGRRMPTPLTIQPAGAYNPNDPTPVARIVYGINRTRANTNVFLPVFRNQSFQTVGDILAVPELTVASPFINTNLPPTDPNYALSDAVCERIPQQILGLLKCDHTPRFVVYAFGQTLKPANHSIVPSGLFTGLCTNYQIMAEAATRAVVRVDGAPTSPHIVVESFNVLPPD
jgi:hypothetical protein